MLQIALYTFLALSSPNLTNQDSQAEKSDFSITESFTVRAGSVEAVVTDKGGKRITGLKPEDFTVLIDDQEVQVTLFDEIKQTVQREVNGVEIKETISQSNYEEQPKPAPGNNYLVFMDDWFTKRAYRGRLLKRLKSEVQQLSPKDRLAIVRYKGDQLQLVMGFSSDKAAILNSIDELGKMRTAELARHTRVMANLNVERQMNRQFESQEGEVDTSWASQGGGGAAGVHANMRNKRAFANEETLFQVINGLSNNLRDTTVKRAVKTYFDQVSQTANAVELAMRGLHQKEGRNTLLLLSEGWTLNIKDALPQGAEAAGAQADGNFINLKEFDSANELLRPITDAANLLGYTIYPLQVSQVDPGVFMATRTGQERASRTLGAEQNGRFSTLNFVAEQTGGQVISKAHRESLPFTKVIEDLQNYYRMSFTFPSDDIHTRHNIKVLVRGDYKVRHRKEFRQRSRDERKNLVSQAAMLTNTSNLLDVQFGEAKKHARRQLALPFHLQFPTDWITALKTKSGGFAVQLELTIEAQDKRGNGSDMLRLPLHFEGTGTPPQLASFKNEMAISKKGQRLVFVLHDLVGGGNITRTVDYKP